MAEVAVAEPLAVHRSGPEDGLPILLLHAFPLDARMWEPVIAELPDVPIVAVDAPGFGDSPSYGLVAAAVGRSPKSSIETYADAVVASLLREGIEHAVVVGLSMGGYVALSLADRYPTLVAAIGLLDTKATDDDEDAKENRLRIAEAAEELGSRAVAPMLTTLLGKSTQSGNKNLVSQIKAQLAEAPPEGITWAQKAMADRPNRIQVLEELEVPGLVLRGAEDAVSSQEAAEAMANALKDSELVVVPGAGHLTALEKPQAVAEALRGLWERARG